MTTITIVTVGLLVYLSAVIALARRPMWALYGVFLLSGVLITPSLPVVGDKVAVPEAFFLLLVGALTLGWATGRFRVHNRIVPQVQLNMLLVGLFLLVVLLSFFNNNIEYGRAAASSILEVVIISYGVVLFLLSVFLIHSWREWERCFLAWVAGMAIVGLVGAYSVVFTPPGFAVDSFTGRISSTLKFENQVPSYVMPLMPVMAYLIFAHGIARRAKLVFAGIVIACLLTLIGTGSRTALLLIAAMVVLLAFMVVVARRPRVLDHGRMGAYMGAGILAVGVYVTVAMATFSGEYRLGKTPTWQRPVAILYTGIVERGTLDAKRTKQFEFALQNFDTAPFIGHGPRFTQIGLHHVLVHNTYLTILLEMGLLGLLFFLSWVLSMGWLAFLGYQNATAPARAQYLMAALTVGLLLLLMYQMSMYGLRHRPLWLMAALMVSAANLNLRMSHEQR